MDHIVTIIVAVLGSGALTAVINLLAHRFRAERQPEPLEAWEKEADLLRKFNKTENILSHEEQRRADVAITMAARSQVVKRHAQRLIPRRTISDIGVTAGGVVISFTALCQTISAEKDGAPGQLLSSDGGRNSPFPQTFGTPLAPL